MQPAAVSVRLDKSFRITFSLAKPLEHGMLGIIGCPNGVEIKFQHRGL
jgi:hypothetical protein